MDILNTLYSIAGISNSVTPPLGERKAKADANTFIVNAMKSEASSINDMDGVDALLQAALIQRENDDPMNFTDRCHEMLVNKLLHSKVKEDINKLEDFFEFG